MSLKYRCQIILLIAVFTNCIIYSNSYSNELGEYNPQREPIKECIYCDPPKPGWIDPFDMTGDKPSSKIGLVDPWDMAHTDKLVVQSDFDNHALKMRLEHCQLYYKRFVNLFLGTLDKNPDTHYLPNTLRLFKMQFFVTGEDLNILQEFGRNKESGVNMESADHIISKIFSRALHEDGQYSVFTTILNKLEKFVKKLTASPEMLVVLSVSLMSLGTMWLVYKTHSFRLAFMMIFMIVMCASFGFTWMRMYEEKEVERYYNIQKHGHVPYHCSGRSMAWYEHMFYRVFGVDCLEFYKIRDIRPVIKVSPAEVFAQTFSSIIIDPAKNIGAAYGGFIRYTMEALPWYLAVITVPLIIVVPPIFVILLLALLFNYNLSISPFTGFKLSPFSSCSHTSDKQYVEDISEKVVEKLKNAQANETPHISMNIPAFKVFAGSGKKKPADRDVDESVVNTEDQNENLSPTSEDSGSAPKISGPQSGLNRVETCKTREMNKKSLKMRCTEDTVGSGERIDELVLEHSRSNAGPERNCTKNKTA